MFKTIKTKIKAKLKIKEKSKHRRNHVLKKDFDKAVLTWNAHEFHTHGEIVGLRIFIFIALLTTIVLGLIYDSWTFSLAIAVFMIVNHIVHDNDNKILKVIISEVGIKVGKRKYRFSNIKSFWFIEKDYLGNMLVINVSNDFAGEVIIQLGTQSIEDVRNILKKEIKEQKGRTMSIVDHLSLLIKL